MELITTALAQDQTQAQASPATGSALGAFFPLILVFVIFYLLIFRPQQKQMKQRRAMLSELKRGDEVVTTGGIYGKITDLQETFVMLQITNNVTIKVDRSQVATVRNPQVNPEEPKK